jgi:hypothetical protein
VQTLDAEDVGAEEYADMKKNEYFLIDNIRFGGEGEAVEKLFANVRRDKTNEAKDPAICFSWDISN